MARFAFTFTYCYVLEPSLNPAIFTSPMSPTVAAGACAIELALSVSPADPPAGSLVSSQGMIAANRRLVLFTGVRPHTFADLRINCARVVRWQNEAAALPRAASAPAGSWTQDGRHD